MARSAGSFAIHLVTAVKFTRPQNRLNNSGSLVINPLATFSIFASDTFLTPRLIPLVVRSGKDGKYVYATRQESGSTREIIRVQVASPNGVTSVAILPGDVVGDDGASVSPDGREIVVSVGEQKSDVWLMENFDPSPR